MPSLSQVTVSHGVAFRSPSSSAGFEPVNLGSNSKHDNH
jgi:hypothetical protein